MQQITIDVGDLKEYVGQPPYPSDKIYKEGTPAGERPPPPPMFHASHARVDTCAHSGLPHVGGAGSVTLRGVLSGTAILSQSVFCLSQCGAQRGNYIESTALRFELWLSLALPPCCPCCPCCLCCPCCPRAPSG